MPGYSVPIKERMMYSSCRNAVVEVIESNLNIKLDKKIEISSGSELTEEFLKVLIVKLSFLVYDLMIYIFSPSYTQWSASTDQSFPSLKAPAGDRRE